ncbi:PREDICTED: N-acetylneuraminate lyase-like isoform X2 [Ceratosolen solmsi marchali]|uniref:N-acetylneuraminate lyase n=1 Tax=Ceratosolen solmsi marchali TaxID=326594 RepID=A0AAJ6YE00_9HYME|nr:PREDICTED: N-acetylneuraminate lyase-like isoform X2 [Ceratosolen solmsi marchali]
MKIHCTYEGLIAPVFTPLNNDKNQSLNLSVIPSYAKFLKSKNINGILVNGTTGEGTSLTIDERKKVTEAWATIVKETNQYLMVQIGGASIRDVKELAEHAESLGVNSILCLPELYFKPNTVDDLIEYLRLIGESAPKTPLLYYDFPKASMVNINVEQLFKLGSEKIPTFSGIKTDLERGLQARRANNTDLKIFLAGDMLMIGGCAAEFDSYIMTSLNFIAKPAFDLLEFGKGSNNLNNARQNQNYINKINSAITSYGTWVETMKIAMSLITNLYMGPPRAPLKFLTKESIEAMDKDLTKIGLKTSKTMLLK